MTEKAVVTPIKELRSGLPWLVLLLIFLVYIYFTYAWPGYWNTNEYSRIFLTRSLIDHQTFDIDAIIVDHNTQDKSFCRGHFYTNKAPGTSFLAAPIYLIIRILEIQFNHVFSEEMVLYLIKVACVSLPATLFIILMFKFFSLITPSYSLRESFLIAYALGTLAWPYSSLFYGHQLAGMCLFLAFLIIFSEREMQKGGKPAFEAGFFCGLAFFIEYPTILISFLIFAYAAVTFKNIKAFIYLALAVGLTWLAMAKFDFLTLKLGLGLTVGAISVLGFFFTLLLMLEAPILFFFSLGIVIPVGVTLYYHLKCFGGMLNFPYYFETYLQFARDHRLGIAGVTYPKPGPLLQLLFSPFRGIFFYSPFLVLAPAGFYKMIRNKNWKNEGWLFIALSVVYFLFLSAFSDWEGGWSMGPRHLTPLIPFWIVALIFLFESVRKKTKTILVLIATPLILISVGFTFLGTAVFPYFPKEFKNPLYDLSWGLILEGKVAPNLGQLIGLPEGFALFPLGVMIIVLLAVLVWDLSFFFSRAAARRFLFSVFCLFLAAGLFFLGERCSRLYSRYLTEEELNPQKIQRWKINSYIQKSSTAKNTRDNQ